MTFKMAGSTTGSGGSSSIEKNGGLELIVLISSDEDEPDKKLKRSPLTNAYSNAKEVNGKDFLKNLGLTELDAVIQTSSNPVPSIINHCDSTKETTIRIVEAHSLPLNLWTESDLAVPSTSMTKDENTLNILESFLKDVKVYCKPRDSNDADKIFEKLRKKASFCPQEYLLSDEFIQKTDSVLNKVRKDRENFFIYIKEVFDEIKRYKPLKIKKPVVKTQENGKGHTSDTSENAEKTERRIEKIYKVLQKLERRIKKAEMKELTFDDMDEDNSHYIYEQKLKNKYMELYQLVCKLEDRSAATGRAVHAKLIYKGSRYPEINKRVQKFINKDKGTYFPDFTDIFNLVKMTNQDSQLNLTEKAAEALAREIFRDVGKELQTRRITDLKESLVSFLPDSDSDMDPAKNDLELNDQLQKNGVEGQAKMNEVTETFVDRQTKLKQEPKEVPDADETVEKEESEKGDSDNSENDFDEDQEEEEDEQNNPMEDKIHNMLGSDDEDSDVDQDSKMVNEFNKEAWNSNCDKNNIKRKLSDTEPNSYIHSKKFKNNLPVDDDDDDIIVLE